MLGNESLKQGGKGGREKKTDILQRCFPIIVLLF